MPPKPYVLMTCAEVREILNRRARGEQELLDHLEEVDAASIYYHTHSYYLRGKYRHDRYPNDFATWVAEQVRDRVLSERLAVLDPFTLPDVEALRRQLVTQIEDHIEELGFAPRALFGDPFDFIRGHVVAVPAGMEIRTREDLREGLRRAPPEALYYHFFEDAFRQGRRHGTLVAWVAEELGDAPLAAALARVNPYRLHLEHLRRDLLRVLDASGGGA
ncbi:MAG TPA: DUF5752 family protein [Planctomycetota bacterium]|nr:DUF5752 family protein [Planctomycetota bacterium]